MNTNTTDNQTTNIIDKAHELGLSKIGIIRASAMDGYDEKVRERISRIPNGKAGYGFIRPLLETSPWAKSVIISATPLTHYNIPEGADKRIGKHYLVDFRIGENPESKFLREFGAFLAGMYRVNDDVKGVRWAAQAAGLGIIRRNNFFYAEDGAYYSLKAWAIDAELDEHIHECNIAPCSEKCNLCIKACPTGSLFEPYTMSILTCISRLTASITVPLPLDDPKNVQIGDWLYGCDACTDCCPHNKGKWHGGMDFPGLVEIVPFMNPLSILKMSYKDIAAILMPRFFYLQEPELWKWKVNALNALANDWKPEYAEDVTAVLSDPNEQVREKAKWILN
ncbi:MAG: epoxyqueuosine reductase [Clostridiales bacterium]|jgi:epoxyqueuosine reductase|nr:epoxyqueuosine reductase [Clostridiales bacterium]